ncbi:MAG: hypothetical protein QRY71_04335 [Candidatus Rhabdochlamydia sp.]
MGKVDHLELLSQRLLEKSCEGLSFSQAELLQDKWKEIRSIAVQNAGYTSWDNHLLNLSDEEMHRLEEVFYDTLQSVEESGMDIAGLLAKEDLDLLGIKLLLDPEVKITPQLLSKELIKALFIEYNPELIARHRKIFQEVLNILDQGPKWGERSSLATETLIGNLISLLPYFDFTEGQCISLYQKIGDQWQKVEYQIQYVPLIEDKIIAYGLIPVESLDASSLLIFRGTPYPAAPGFFDALFSDFHPACSIGKDIFEAGRKNIDAWIRDKGRVKCFGLSLGGALAYHMGIHYGPRVEIYVYGAPGVISENHKMKKIQGKVFFHYEDVIQLIGFHPQSKHCQMYAVLTKEKKDLFITHTQPLGLGSVVILKVYPRYENRRALRYLFNVFKAVISMPLFLILFPIRVSSKCVEKIQKKWRLIKPLLEEE